MRSPLFALSLLALAAAVPVLAQPASLYQLELHSADVKTEQQGGRPVTLVTVNFTISQRGQQVRGLASDYKILIEEEGQVVREVDIPEPEATEDLSVVLAVDTSGSMKEHGRMAQARAAADVFFQELPAAADAGLVLFDDQIRVTEPLGKNRLRLTDLIHKTEPRGGTAYLDACNKAVEMLRAVQGRERAVVVMTDGVDLNSRASLEQVVEAAKVSKVRVYPVGIGRPGGEQRVTSVLVLDRSGSMLLPASDSDKVSKLEALKKAAKRFADTIRYTKEGLVRASVIEFSDTASPPRNFTSQKNELFGTINELEGKGETAVFDATYDAVAALEAEGAPGRKAVIALTDGVDNSSRRRVEEVIRRAKEAKIPLLMLGFGRPGELDEAVMRRMADETGGSYYHAGNEGDLIRVFEELSIRLHDDGIDEATLTRLAAATGGKYYPAQDVEKLKLVLQTVTREIRPQQFRISFPSRYQRSDGLARDVRLKLVRRTGGAGPLEVVESQGHVYQRRGLVLAQTSPVVYLSLLAALGLLLALPAGLSRLGKRGAGS